MPLTTMTLELAQKLIAQAQNEAARQNVPIAAYVVDDAGNLVAFARMEGVSAMAIDVTRRKAYTAYNFRFPTHAMLAVRNSDAAVANDLDKNPNVCIVPGGIPLIVAQKCIGAIGVSGGRSEQDRVIAEHAVNVALASEA